MKSTILKGIRGIRNLLDKVEDKMKDSEPIEKTSGKPLLIPYSEVRQPQIQNSLLSPISNAPDESASTFESRKPMNEKLRIWAKDSGHTLKELKAMLRAHVGIKRIDYMTNSQIIEACAWIDKNIKAINSDKNQRG